MSRRLLRSAALAFLLHTATARAEDVYMWTDSSGETHYTNNIVATMGLALWIPTGL